MIGIKIYQAKLGWYGTPVDIDVKNYILNIFRKVKFIKAPTGFELKTNRFVNNALTQCSILLNCMIKRHYFLLSKLFSTSSDTNVKVVVGKRLLVY